MVFRNVAHIVCLCEASDEYGGIAIHREIAKEYGMIGMVVHPAISSQSVAIFIRGDHDVGTFIELLGHHQHETKISQVRSGSSTVQFSAFVMVNILQVNL